MNNDIYRKIKRQYDIKRQTEVDKANKLKEKIYSENPKLEEIEKEINMLALKITRNILNSDEITRQVEEENMKSKLEKLKEKYDKELKKIGLSYEDLLPKVECNLCNDTGLIKNGDILETCKCFRQEIINETYKQSNINKLDEENFETFDIGFYSNKRNKEKYGIDKSPLENIECIRKLALNFVENINNAEQKNLLFVGNTGLGKTFSYDKTGEQKEQYNKIFDVDLLIIDDLGTETMSNNKFTELFNIINTRLLKNKKILISTNLTLNELYKQYDERVMSRLIGNFTICKFIGEDIRLKKKIEEQAKKVEKLNKFSEHMHFLDDNEIVEIYEVIHNEERILKELKEKLALFKSRLEEKEVSAEK